MRGLANNQSGDRDPQRPPKFLGMRSLQPSAGCPLKKIPLRLPQISPPKDATTGVPQSFSSSFHPSRIVRVLFVSLPLRQPSFPSRSIGRCSLLRSTQRQLLSSGAAPRVRSMTIAWICTPPGPRRTLSGHGIIPRLVTGRESMSNGNWLATAGGKTRPIQSPLKILSYWRYYHHSTRCSRACRPITSVS